MCDRYVLISSKRTAWRSSVYANERQEYILLSDILGLSLLVDSIDHPKPPSSTEGTVLGPFHTHDAPSDSNGTSISGDPNGEALLVLCTVKTTSGDPVSDVKVDVWETDSHGKYDVQYGDREKADGRAIVRSDEEGVFWFKGIVPVPYPIPDDGPVGKLLEKLGRHCWRPSHMHFMFEKAGFDNLVTYVYPFPFPYPLLHSTVLTELQGAVYPWIRLREFRRSLRREGIADCWSRDGDTRTSEEARCRRRHKAAEVRLRTRYR
jgi:protocatechuate 3,4-dioxygenase beta subunit